MATKKMPKMRNGLVPFQFLMTPENWRAIELGTEIEAATSGKNYLMTDFIRDAIREKLIHLGVDFGDIPPRGAAAQAKNKAE